MIGNRTARRYACAVCVLLVAGSLHGAMRASRAGAASVYRPLSVPLSTLPTQIGPYLYRQDLTLGAEVIQIAGVDRVAYREYADTVTGRPLHVYVGYWGRQNAGLGHGPDVCYPATGWRSEGPARHDVLRFVGIDGTSLEAPLITHHFERAAPGGIQRRAVAFLAVIGGQFCSDWRGGFQHRPPDSPNEGFVAHIQVATPVIGSAWEEADRCVSDLMEGLLPGASRCLFRSERSTRERLSPTHVREG